MNESFWTAELVLRISELALQVVALGAVSVLLLETVYLLIFTVFMVRRNEERQRASRPRPPGQAVMKSDQAPASARAGDQMRHRWGFGVHCGALALLVLRATAPALAQNTYRSKTPPGLDEYYPVPETNLLTAAKIALGRRLFFDPMLSVDRTLACASCHRPTHGFSDTVARSRGVRAQKTVRNVPSILNRAYGQTQFWDGRASSLEQTVIQPIRNPREMDLSLQVLVGRLREDSTYRRAFAQEFPDTVTEQNVARSSRRQKRGCVSSWARRTV